MDKKSAEELLVTIREQQASEKQAEGEWGALGEAVGNTVGAAGRRIKGLFSGMTADQKQEVTRLRALVPQQVAKQRQRNILNAIMLAGAGGAALRGGLGLSRMLTESKSTPIPSRTVDMQFPFPGDDEDEKRAEDPTVLGRLADKYTPGLGPSADPQSTEESGAGFYWPSLLLGTPLAAYAGWKGIDAIFDKQRKAKTQHELDKAKERYEEALVGAYKTASADPADCLNNAFDSLEKASIDLNPKTWFPNLSGQAKGLLATYALLSGPAAYMYVDDKMKKTSKRSILEKAMKERAARQARSQPAELYAVPQPRPQREEEEEKDDLYEDII